MKLNIPGISLFFALLVMLPSCLQVPSYRPKSLGFIHNKSVHQQTKNNVILQIKKLEEDEKFYLFGEYKTALEEYSILYFSIHNLSPYTYHLSSDFTNLAYVSPSRITKMIKTNTIARAVIAGTGVPPTIVGTYLALAAILLPPGIPAAGVGLFGAALIGLGITAAFGGKAIKSSINNRSITKDLKKKMSHKNVVIPSGALHEGLILVKTIDLRRRFTIDLHEHNAPSTLQFEVALDN